MPEKYPTSILKLSNALLLAAIYLIYKSLIFGLHLKELAVFAYFPPWPLLIVLSVMLGWDTFRRPAVLSFVEHFKINARFSLATAFFVSLCVWIYHKFIDISAFQEMIELRLQAFQEGAGNISQLTYQKNLSKVFNPFFYTTMTLSGLTAIGLLLSAGMAGLRIVFKRI